MSTCVVTGAAGFVGSHLCEALIERGHEVVGIDAFVPYYPRSFKELNLQSLKREAAFSFHELDLRTDDIRPRIKGAAAVFHLAAMAGLMRSWSDFSLYSSCNAEGTQRLLDAVREEAVPHFLYVSTSSVYGKEATGDEQTPLAPFSPYGITKLAGEQLCRAYEANFQVPITILRYFSVYGPRQRPDMAYHIMIRALLEGGPFVQFGDGEQTRSNTYCRDAVEATILAFEKRDQARGEVFNIGGGEIISLNTVRQMLEELLDRKINIEKRPARPGDQKHTAANIAKAQRILGYQPGIKVRDGLLAQIEWQRALPQ
jgi:UDP-glucuronate 4-epimerase